MSSSMPPKVVPDDFSVYMPVVAFMASFLTIVLFSMVIVAPSPKYREFDVILGFQTLPAVLQLVLLVLLNPRILYLGGCFLVTFHGPARTFSNTLQIVGFAVSVGLATHHIWMTVISLSHRLLVLSSKEFIVFKIGPILVAGTLPGLAIIAFLALNEDWSNLASPVLYNHTIAESRLIGYNITTAGGMSIMGVILLSPPIAFCLAMLLRSKTKQLLSGFNEPALQELKNMHEKLLKAFVIVATIPLIAEFVVVVWFFARLTSNQASGQFDCVVFGVAPLSLGLQALTTLHSSLRYKRATTRSLIVKVVAIVSGISALFGFVFDW